MVAKQKMEQASKFDKTKKGIGKAAAPSKEEAADTAAEMVQNRIRGILARQEIENMR